MIITLNGKSKTYENPTLLKAVIHDLMPEAEDRVLGCLCGATVIELNEFVRDDCRLSAITLKDEEGKRMYERTMRFIFLLAVKRCFPETKIRFEHSIGHGIYVVAENQRFYPNDVITLEGMMRDIVREDLPFMKKTWSKDQAIEYFSAHGEQETARLLSFRPYDFFRVYECGGMAGYFYGAMLPSTGWTPVFALHSKTPGIVILKPDDEKPDQPAAFLSAPKHMAAFAQSNWWCKVLSCTDAADLNDFILQNRFAEFIRINEALHDKSLAEIAEDIVQRGARAIFIAGPSSSGKTTFANRLAIHLRVNGQMPVMISLDDFYRNRDELPLEENGQPDLEALSALDVDYLNECLRRLLSGETAMMPRFSFKTQRRKDDLVPLRIGPMQPLIIEGIHALNPSLHTGFDRDLLFRIYISELTCLNLDPYNRIRTTDARLLRRIVRDYQFRHTPPAATLSMWDSVRRGEEKWIFPFQEQADTVFNSALHYELPVLKRIAYQMLDEIPRDDPHSLMCNRLLKVLHYFLPVSEKDLTDIPPLSILREFIGGNTLYIK